jgi:hypothetical protein
MQTQNYIFIELALNDNFEVRIYLKANYSRNFLNANQSIFPTHHVIQIYI